MARKKKEKKNELKEEVKKPKNNGIPLHVYFAIRGIKKHRQAGMKMYKDASKKCMTLVAWDDFFSSY